MLLLLNRKKCLPTGGKNVVDKVFPMTLGEMCLESVDERQLLSITTDSVRLNVECTTLGQCIWHQATIWS